MAQTETTTEKMTTEEVIRTLFPKSVVESAKQAAAEADARTKSSIRQGR